MSSIDEQNYKLLERSMLALREHFDAVQIFASVWDPAEGKGATSSYVVGGGNLNARYGHVKIWAEKHEEEMRGDVRNGGAE